METKPTLASLKYVAAKGKISLWALTDKHKAEMAQMEVHDKLAEKLAEELHAQCAEKCFACKYLTTERYEYQDIKTHAMLYEARVMCRDAPACAVEVAERRQKMLTSWYPEGDNFMHPHEAEPVNTINQDTPENYTGAW